MKTKVFVLFCASFALTLFSCQKEENTPEEETPVAPSEEVIPEGYSRLTLSAVTDETKTTLDGTVVKWASGDQIKVYCSDGSATDFELVGEGGSATGDFTGLVPSGKTAFYAVYPKDLYSSVSSSTVNVTIPDTQDGVFGKGNIAVAKIDSETHDMDFVNVNAFVEFTIPAGITKVVISSVGDSGNLSGTLAVDCSGDTPVAGTLSSGGTSITTTFPESTGGTYYVAMAPGITHSKGLLLEWYKGSEVSGTYWLNKAITTAANNVYEMGAVSAEGDYYVTVDGAGKHNGMNWENAWSADQFWSKLHPGGTDTAMDNAKLANINGATFHLGAGTYNFGDTPLLSFNEDDPVTITFKGDYPAAGDSSQTRPTESVDNRAYFTGNGTHSALILRGKLNVSFDGIGFINGYATGDEESTDTGKTAAALDCLGPNVSVSMSHCSVKNNTHKNYTSGTGNWGAGIRLNGVGSFTADSVTFAHNTAYAAPALSVRNTSVTLEKCKFIDNKSSFDCGALYVNGSSATASITDCTFTGNEAINEDGAGAIEDYGKGLGGAIKCVDGGTLTITGGTFSNNKAWKGGAIYVKNSSSVKTLHAIGTTFTGNGSGNTRGGGAIFTEASITIDDCTFSYNNAACWGGAIEMEASKNYYVRGGTFYCNAISTTDPDYGGGAMCLGKGTLQMNKGTNGLSFTENTSAGMGGALFLGSNTSFTDASFSSNSSDLDGGAIYVKSGTATIHDASFTGNHARYGGSMSISSNAEIYKTQFNSNYATEGGAIYIEQTSGNHAWFDRCSFSERNYITKGNGLGTTIKVSASDEFCMNNCSIDDGTYNQNAENNFSRTSWIAVTAAKSMFSNCSFIGNVRKGENGNTIVSEKGSMIYISPTVAADKCFFINSIVACNLKSFQSWNSSGFGHVKLYYTYYNTTQDLTIDGTPEGGASGVTNGNGDVGNASWSSNCWSWNGKIKGADVSKATAGDILSLMNGVSSSFVSWLGSDKYLDGQSVKRGSGKDTDEWWPGAYQPAN